LGHNAMTTNQFGERYIYAVNRGMFEQESAFERIKREFGDFLAREDSLFVIIGSDSGNLISFLGNLPLPAGSRFIFIETGDLLRQLDISVEASFPPKRVFICTPENFDQVAEKAGLTNYFYTDSVFLRRSLSAEYGYVALYREFYWEIDAKLQQLRYETIVHLGREAFVQRQLQNCADNLHPLSNIEGCLEGRTVIVLAGGPSLDDHIKWVKKNRNRLVIFAVSRISRRLQQVDLEPDFIFSVDPQDISYEVSKEMLNFGPNVTFICQYHVAPQLLSQWPHRCFYMGELLPWQSDLNPEKVFPGAGPTVTNAAVGAAVLLGSKRILMTGVDFCYTPDGFTHAKGSKEQQAGPKTDLSNLMVETNAGEKAHTIPGLAEAAQTISLIATSLKVKGVRIINLAPSAARMEGVEFETCDEVLLEEDDISFGENIAMTGPDEGWLKRLRDELSRIIDITGEIELLLSEALEVHGNMYKGEYVDPVLKGELESIDMKLQQDYSSCFRLIKVLAIRALLRMTYSAREESEIGLDQVRTRLDLYYKALQEGACRLRTYLDKGLDSVEVRLLEVEPVSEATMKLLTEAWIRRKEPGRAKIFRARHSLRNYECLKLAEQAFDQEMSRDNLSELSRADKHRNLAALPNRIQQLKDKMDTDGLSQLYNSFCNDEEAAGFLPLIRATSLLLEGKLEQVMTVLEPVVSDPESPVLEQSLALLVGVCSELGLYQLALDAMAGLAAINAVYLKPYAEALAANEQRADAIAHMADYLHYFPEDDKAIIYLIRLYEQAGIAEGVELGESMLMELLRGRS